ncbi:serine/threonine protein kinase [Thermosulfuriphilus sp.]
MKEEIFRLASPYLPGHHRPRIFTDTSDFMRINPYDIIKIKDHHYLVLREEKERRFGMDEPKYWVKRAIELETGQHKIIKLTFHELFPLKLGEITIVCYRSPEKEARILDLVRGHPNFMQGFTIRDIRGNPVRVIEIIRGKPIDYFIAQIELDHYRYFRDHFPHFLEYFVTGARAISFLHQHGERHGDVRRDHLYLETETKRPKWIDFDYNFDYQENPFGLDIFGLGSILLFISGGGIYTATRVAEEMGEETARRIEASDYSLIYRWRIMNLKKLFPYIPEELNYVLMHFSTGAEVFYESVEEFLEDLAPVIKMAREGKHVSA